MSITKKVLRVTCVDGRVIEDEIKPNQQIPFNAAANSMEYYQAAAVIATQGYVDKSTNGKHLILLAPSQIKTVEIIFLESTIQLHKA